MVKKELISVVTSTMNTEIWILGQRNVDINKKPVTQHVRLILTMLFKIMVGVFAETVIQLSLIML